MAQTQPTFTDIQRRKIEVEIVSKDGIPALSVDKILPGGSSERVLLLNPHDARRFRTAIDNYLNEASARELNGNVASLSPKDMVELFGEADD
ncbi:hypothetical protein QP027_02935 [Corynebacterium breve]|uniref:Uncharacterized protein n=1 Tax=Corynebacterium breve TaxID=3049799 RepID=A0ABY8VFE1_9CORY|nr:hypothetical protein [Corynebacterium breve]WIM68366.1 hypothetical protein QP027_02935 [Corynebacterium breve]